MPGKRKILPRPCPVCKKEYGTFQVVFFLRNEWRLEILFRIGHYDAEAYKRAKQRSSNLEYQVKGGDAKLKKDLKNAQRKWCSFESDHDIKFDEKYIIGYMRQNKKKTWTTNPHGTILADVKREGWGRKGHM